jgi:AraC-like DNA-binding protein
MDWQAEHTQDREMLDATPAAPAAPLGALRAVLGAAERLGVARSELLAAVALEAIDDLSDVDREALARLQAAAVSNAGCGRPRDTYRARVRVVLAKLIAEGRCSVEDVAKELAVSARTLQRRLEQEGTTFGGVCDDARRTAALEHLRNPRVAIKEAAFLLGFSEPSTFYRAFRRWTGDTPANYRRALAPT